MVEPTPELALAAICRLPVQASRSRLSIARLRFTPKLDISRVREHLARITDRGYAREQDLEAKLAVVLHDVRFKR
jgi:hypothetical protein